MLKKLSRVLGLGCLVCISARGGVQTLEYTYEGEKLKYVISEPAKPSNDLFIFAHGENGDCTKFNAFQTEAILKLIAPPQHVVIAEGLAERRCDTSEFKSLLFLYRADELHALIQTIEKTFDEKAPRIHLIGHSAGANIVARAARLNGSVHSVILVGGPAQGYEQMTYRRLFKRAKAGDWSEDKIDEEIKKLNKGYLQMRKEPDAMSGKRSNRYWLELFDHSTLDELRSDTSRRPVLVIHGENDDIVPFEEAHLLYSSLLVRGTRPTTLKTFPQVKHSMSPEVIVFISKWVSVMKD